MTDWRVPRALIHIYLTLGTEQIPYMITNGLRVTLIRLSLVQELVRNMSSWNVMVMTWL